MTIAAVAALAAVAGYSIGRLGSGRAAETCGGCEDASGAEARYAFSSAEPFPGEYVSAAAWPPKLDVVDAPFACDGTSGRPGNAAKPRKIGNRTYCVSETPEGAAGSAYVDYAYAFELDGKTAVLSFALRYVQCANYDEQRMRACAAEQASFDVDGFADGMASSAKRL